MVSLDANSYLPIPSHLHTESGSTNSVRIRSRWHSPRLTMTHLPYFRHFLCLCCPPSAGYERTPLSKNRGSQGNGVSSVPRSARAVLRPQWGATLTPNCLLWSSFSAFLPPGSQEEGRQLSSLHITPSPCDDPSSWRRSIRFADPGMRTADSQEK